VVSPPIRGCLEKRNGRGRLVDECQSIKGLVTVTT